MQPNKLPRPIASSHPIVENGWKSDPSQIITQFAPEKQVLPFNHKADIKEHKINALAETQHSNSASMNSSSTTVQTTEKCEASAKQPHPDSKYLSQILSVPKIEECSNFDDQEWLFSSKNLSQRRWKWVLWGLMEQCSVDLLISLSIAPQMWQFPKGIFQEGMLTSGPDFTNSYCILLLIILSQISSLRYNLFGASGNGLERGFADPFESYMKQSVELQNPG
ncbi:hypothetical protein CK203_108813 [Vitis vinifera]|uniref:Uncharacterized protein n=1 Tax=Vitis vinifera TaxID=29760 RepID=A0A438CDZ9_VITVI|nr:hypothetical protein CK203_108813 [Vitis vinifera]